MESDHKCDGRRHQAWVFTCNNPQEDDEVRAYALAAVSECGAVAWETGALGTPHLQGCVRFGTMKTWKQVCAELPRCYVAAKAINSNFHQWWNYQFKGEQSREEWAELGTDGPNHGQNADVYTWGDCPSDNRKEDANAKASRNLASCMKRDYDTMDTSVVCHQLRNYQYGARAIRAARWRASCCHYQVFVADTTNGTTVHLPAERVTTHVTPVPNPSTSTKRATSGGTTTTTSKWLCSTTSTSLLVATRSDSSRCLINTSFACK